MIACAQRSLIHMIAGRDARIRVLSPCHRQPTRRIRRRIILKQILKRIAEHVCFLILLDERTIFRLFLLRLRHSLRGMSFFLLFLDPADLPFDHQIDLMALRLSLHFADIDVKLLFAQLFRRSEDIHVDQLADHHRAAFRI